MKRLPHCTGQVFSSSVMVTFDHVPILSSRNIIPNPPPPATTFTYRRLNKINYHKFICDLNSIPLITNPPVTPTELFESYFTTLRSLLDRHAPLITKSNKSSRTTLSPWITSEIIKLKPSRRRLEHTYISSHSLLDYKILRTATNHYHRAISAAKKAYFSSRILSSLSNPRTLWKKHKSYPTQKYKPHSPNIVSSIFSTPVICDLFL